MGGNKITGAFAVLAALAVGGFLAYQQYYRATSAPKGIACTQEAKQCPDGSYVSRTGPNCEFAACPAEEKQGSVIDTSTWKTYRNEKYGFEVRYPEQWILLEDKVANPRLAGLWIPEKYSRENTLYSYTSPEILVSILLNSQKLDFQTLTEVKKIDFWGKPTSIIIGNGVKAWSAVRPGLGDGEKHLYIAPMDNSFFIDIYTGWDSGLTDTVLSTFRFVQ